jgi:excisionase family DNA binding protein
MAKKTQVRSNESVGKRLLNVREAARYLGLEVDTVYRKARLRELPCVKVGRALRFDVRALERFVEQHTIQTMD